MLKRVVKVDDFRAMRAWSSSVEFKNVNLIYGSNGSGKSTFASLFEEFVRDPSAVGGVRVEILDGSNRVLEISDIDDYFWPNVRVFNRNYVARNIRFDGAGGPNAGALMTLGERQIEAESRRGEIQERLDGIASEQPTFQREVATAQQGLASLLTRTAQQIGQELQAVSARYNTRTYRAPMVRALLTDREALTSSASADVEQDLGVVTMPAMETIRYESPEILDLTTLVPELETLLGRTVTSVPISDLANNAQAEHWVQDGLPLHEGAAVCLFCGGVLTDERHAHLARHFDASLVALQGELSALRVRLTNAIGRADRAVDQLPNTNLLFEPLREEYEVEIGRLGAALITYRQYGDAITAAIDGKAEHLFTVVSVPELPTPTVLNLATAAATVKSHNQQLVDLDDLKTQAASRIESARVLAIAQEIDTYQTLIDTNQDAIQLLQDEREGLITERDNLPNSELDPRPIASSLNSDLAYLLGRDELRFAVNGEQYEIQRSGEPARHLSEGERTAISLLYFLSSLESHDVDQSRLTVIIDDPVSSLDSGVLVGASSHLWSRVVEAVTPRQVFILTHNFELFRMWSNQFDRRQSRQIRARPAALYELRMKATNVGGVPRREPVMAEWPADANIRKRIRSEYHYLFWRLAHTLEECRSNPSVESDIDAAAILPNVARRVLEGFLAFKYPEMIDNFEGAVMRANENADPATQQRIVRFLHQYSHNGEADTSRGVPRPEAVTVLTAVFDLMKAIDQEHLTAMCSALDIDETQVTTPAQAA